MKAQKTPKNIVLEWAQGVRELSGNAYSNNKLEMKNMYLQRIIGRCDAIIQILALVNDEEK